MFKRKNRRSFFKILFNYIWPDMGWKRFFVYVKQRVVRLSDTPHRIALGLSFGVAASFNPYVGTHILQACVLAYVFGANFVAGALGTVIGNPSTFPLFWWISILTGSAILGLFGVDATHAIPQDVDLVTLVQTALDDPANILLPWTIGGYVLGAVALIVSYVIFYPLVKGAKIAREKLVFRKKKKEVQ